jgi:hypothetical protein
VSVSRRRDLAVALAGGAGGDTQLEDIVRYGTVSAVGSRNDGGATYTVVTIGGFDVRCLRSYTSPAPGDVVVWLRTRKQAVCLGPL